MKKLVFATALIFLTFTTAAQVNYQAEVNRDQVLLNTSAILSCSETGSESCPVNSWQLNWKIPQNAEILGISDSIGKIEEYTRKTGQVQLQTNTGPARKQEKIEIRMKIEEDAQKIAKGLYTRTISLPGFPDTRTAGEIRVENLLSASLSPGFQKGFSNNSMTFRGEGPLSANLNFGTGDKLGEYAFFGPKAENATLAYKVAVGTTGISQTYPYIPVAVLDNQTYNSVAPSWSKGEYDSGVITLRQNEQNTAPVLAEETVHAFNAEFLDYDKTSSSWLDEGIAGHVQSLVRKTMVRDSRRRKLFSEDTSYTDRQEGSLYQVTKPSKGDKEDLWKYYRENRGFMKSWKPQDAETRSFGYAYAELIVKNHVSQNNTLRQLYQDIEPEVLQTNEEKWQFYSKYLDLTPCKYESRQKFENCLERVNSYDYPVYSVEKIPEDSSNQLEVEELEVPNYSTDERFRNRSLFKQGFVSSLINWIQNLISSL